MKKTLLLIPALLALGSCTLFGSKTSAASGATGKSTATQKKAADKAYLDTTITVNGEEKDKDAFIAAVPQYQTISPETKGYNYCVVSYSVCKEVTGEKNPGSPAFYLKANSDATAWWWEIAVKGNDIYVNGPEAINRTASEVVNDGSALGDTRDCKYIVGENVYYFASRSVETLGKYTYYRRYEYKFNQYGDVMEADYYEGYLASDGDSYDSSRHTYTVAYSMKTA
jgi:hypothetical protein